MRNIMRAALAAVCMLLIAGDVPVRAQTSARKALIAAKALRCVFPLLATGTWVEAAPRAEVKNAKLTIEFHSIDTQDGAAEAKGGLGATHVIARLAGGHLHFLQIGSEGPVYVTTVFDQETSGGKLMAVHTRHEYTKVSLPGFTSRPEQYYGECEVQP